MTAHDEESPSTGAAGAFLATSCGCALVLLLIGGAALFVLGVSMTSK